MSEQADFEQFFKQFTAGLPRNLFALQEDLEKNLRAALSGAFERMNLVTREEFEVQAVLLARTRTRLEALEKRVAELEAGKNESTGDPSRRVIPVQDGETDIA